MLKKIRLIILLILLIYGMQLIYEWNSNRQFYKEGDTLEEIGLNELTVGEYVSFYIDDYTNKEIYVDENIEYEIYTILIENGTVDNEDKYIQVMVKERETKQKLQNKERSKVYFHGQVISAPYGGFTFNKDLFIGTDEVDYLDNDKLILTEAIVQTELQDEVYGLYIGIALVLFSLIAYHKFGGIEGCVPDVVIESKKYDEYNLEYSVKTFNIRNEWQCEKDNLKKLQAEQIENKKACNVLIVVFILGLIFYCSVPVFFIKIFGFIPLFIGTGGVWSRFINSSHKLAVYIAKKREKRSIYLETEVCKKNIEELERIMEEKDL